MSYGAGRTRSGFSKSKIIPFKTISSRISDFSVGQCTLAPLVSFDEHGDVNRSTPSTTVCVTQPNACRRCLCSWKEFCRVSIQLVFSQLGLFALVILYIAFGGLLFYSIESQYESRQNEQIKINHLHGIHNIRHIATDEFNWMLNASFELRYALWRGMLSRLDGHNNIGWQVQVHYERFDRLIGDELARMQAEQEKLSDKHDTRSNGIFNQKWTFSAAMLYSATVITTVGYGNITPKSILGKLITCLYATVGIPIMIMYLRNTGDLLAFFFIKYYSMINHFVERLIHAYQCRGRQRRRRKKSSLKSEYEGNQDHVPIAATIAVLVLYITAGAVLFSHWEGWSYVDGAYFSFITFTTIGLGDLVPGQGTLTENKNGKSILCALFLLFGLILTAMCFKLMQDDIFMIKRRLFARFSFDSYHHPPHHHHRRHRLQIRENST